MSLTQQHIIKKQVLEVEMQDPPDAFSFRNRLGELYHEKIFPQLEEVFNEACSNEKFISIDSLMIDIGEIDEKNWEEELVAKTIAQLRKELLLNKETFTGVDSTALVNGRTKNEFKSEDRDEESNEEDAGAGNENYFIKIFFYFIQHGSLPWNALPVSKQMFEEELNTLLLQQPVEFTASVISFLKTAGTEQIKRLVYQLPLDVLERIALLLMVYYSTDIVVYKKTKRELEFHLRRTLTEDEIQQVLHRSFFEVMKEGNEVKNSFDKKYAAQVAALVEERVHQPGITEALRKAFDIEKPGATKQVQKLVKPQEKKSPDASKEKQHDELYIYNTGLVLLHPYLFPLFTNTGLINEQKQFRDEYCSSVAVLLSQYLVTGEKEFPEYDLMLNKILCGIDIHEPVMTALNPEDRIFEEADDLLQQVIAMWKMNGVDVNKTVENLRASFLQRAGKLIHKEEGWLLQAEQKSYDIVLSSLPWGISIIKNELMKNMLWVEWT